MIFNTKKELINHQKYKCNKEYRLKKTLFYICQYHGCFKSFKSIDSLKRHQRLKHIYNGNIGSNVNNIDKVSKHINIKNKKNGNDNIQNNLMKLFGELKHYKCKLCWKKFTRKSALNDHYITHKSRNKRHVCHICGSQFGLKSNKTKKKKKYHTHSV